VEVIAEAGGGEVCVGALVEEAAAVVARDTTAGEAQVRAVGAEEASAPIIPYIAVEELDVGGV